MTPILGVVGEKGVIEARVGAFGHQSFRRVGEQVGLVRRVGDAAQVAVGVEREDRRLPVLRDDGRRVAVPVPLDGGDVAVAIGDGCEASLGVIAEYPNIGSGGGVDGAQVPAAGIELEKLRPVLGGKRQVRGGEARQRQGHFADAVRCPVRQIHIVIRTENHPVGIQKGGSQGKVVAVEDGLIAFPHELRDDALAVHDQHSPSVRNVHVTFFVESDLDRGQGSCSAKIRGISKTQFARIPI